MTTEANPNGAANAAPNAPVQPANAAQAGAQPATKPKYEVDYDPNNPPWLNDRLDRERKSAAKEAEANARKAMLAELGVDDPEIVKRLAADEKKRQEAQKSLETKLAERELALSNKDARLKELEEAVKIDATEQLAALTEEQRKAVLDLAGEDPAKQRKAIATLRPTWTKPAQSQEQQTQTNQNGSQGSQVPPNQTPPSTTPAKPTAPANVAPPDAGSVVVSNHLQTYEQLLKVSPFVAADYYQANFAAINAARANRSN